MVRALILPVAVAALLPALGASALAQSGAPEKVIVEAAKVPASPDICLKIADAKIKQWAQKRIQRDRTDLFADGKVRKTEFIFTENALYFQIGEDWRASQVGWSERETEDPAAIAKRMQLSDCSVGETVQEDGQSLTRFTYSQGPRTATTLWVSDTTGLPLRMEIHQQPEKPDQPTTIAFRYAYGDDVKVPAVASTALDARTRRAQAMLTALQLHHSAW
jgi:hypothetical protein